MKKSGGRYTRYKVSYSWEGDCEMGENKMPHIQLPENLGIRYAVLPGDPARAERAAGYLKDAKLLTFNREYKSYSGFWNGVPVLVMSTGMGGPSMAIAVEELQKIGVEAAGSIPALPEVMTACTGMTIRLFMRNGQRKACWRLTWKLRHFLWLAGYVV